MLRSNFKVNNGFSIGDGQLKRDLRIEAGYKPTAG